MKFNIISILITIAVCLFSTVSSDISRNLGFHFTYGSEVGNYCFMREQCENNERCDKSMCTKECENQHLCLPPGKCVIINHLSYCFIPPSIDEFPIQKEFECYRNWNCPINKMCHESKCINPCDLYSSCGRNTKCYSNNHKPICKCFTGYEGNPYHIGCKKSSSDSGLIKNYCSSNQDCPQYEECVNNKCRSACDNIKCGPGTNCYTLNHAPVCECLEGRKPNFDRTECVKDTYNIGSGNLEIDRKIKLPEQNNIRKPKIFQDSGCTDDDCKYNETCTGGKCVPACNHCGPNTTCDIKNHFGICVCYIGYTGDPYGRGCEKPKHGVCHNDEDCKNEEKCSEHKCVRACDTAPSCGFNNTHCTATNHRHTCTCLNDFKGDPYSPDGCN